MLTISSLISKLSKREKFFFHKHYRGSEKKSFFILYKYIQSNPSVNFKTLKNHFNGTPIGKNLSVELNLLQKKILRSLHIYNLNNKSTANTILKNTSYARILFEKNELKSAIKLIVQTKKLAYKYEEFSFLTHLLILEEEIGYDTIDESIHQRQTELRLEREKLIKLVNELIELKRLRSKIIELQYSERNIVLAPESFPDIFKNDFVKQDDYHNSKIGKDHFYLIKSISYSLLGQTNKSLKYDKLKLENVKENRHIFTAIDELKSMNNIIYHYILLKDKKNYLKEFEIFKTYKYNNDIPPSLFAYFNSYLQMQFALELYDTKRLKSLISYVENTLKSYTFNITQHNMLYHFLVGSLIIIKDFNKAHDILIEWDKIKKISYVNNAKKVARLIIYKELNSTSLLKNELRNFRKYFPIKNDLTELLFNYFKSHLDTKNKISESYLNSQIIRLSKRNELKRYYAEFYLLSWGKSINGEI